MCLESWGKSNYARILIKINASNDFSDNLVMAVLNLKGTGYTKETIRVEYKMAKGKGGSSKADDDGFIKVKKKKLCGDGTFSLSNSFEALNVENPVIKELLDGKCVLVDDDGKLRETVECSGDQGREDEVEYVENEMASYLALRPSRVEYDTKSLSSYARVMIELRADVELKENIVVVMPKINEEEFHTFNMHVEYEWKPLRCACCKIFGHTQVECPKNLDLHAGAGETRKKKPSKAPKVRFYLMEMDCMLSTSGCTGTTPIMDKIWKFENLVIDGQAILVDEAGNPLKKVEYPGDHDSEDEVASVDNDMARSLASEKAGFVTQSLLEQWRDSYSNGDYDEDSYDDDMYEGQDLSEEIQTLCEKLDIRVRDEVATTEEEPLPNRRDQRDLEIAAQGRRIRELERLLAQARLEDYRDDEESEGSDFDSNESINEEDENPWGVNRPDRDRRFKPGRINSSQNLGMKIDIPDFEGKSHPDEFIDWLHTEHVIKQHTRDGKAKIVNWSKMKKKLMAKNLPVQYRQEAFIEYHNYKQTSISVEEFTSEFDRLRLRCDVVEEDEETIARYLAALKPEISDVVQLQQYWSS
ncbi:RNA-directed DNA polymerase [Tanacetum coccineum]